MGTAASELDALRRRGQVAMPLLAPVFALLAWWGWKQGAYFNTVFFPGAIAIFALLALMLLRLPFSGRFRGPARVAFCALTALALWTLLSMAWSPTPATAFEDAQRIFAYAALFAIGLWLSHLLGVRMLWALAPVAGAGVAAGIGTVIALLTSTDFDWLLHGDATLRFPIGYRNANAAFFLICLWPLLLLATEMEGRWKLRAAMVAASTMLVEIAFLAQSRGSLPALVAAAVLYLALSPHGLRAAAIAGRAVLPAIPAVPILLDVYQHGEADPAIVPLLRDAAEAIVVTTLLSGVLAALALRGVYPRLSLGAAGVRRVSRIAAGAAIAVAAVGATLFVAEHGGPVGFADQRISEFTGGYPDLSGQPTRFGANVGSNRDDFWRVSLEEWADHPLAGEGAGSFRFTYLRHRDSHENPEDPHSVEMLMLSELGIVGFGLFTAFVVAAVLAAWRSRRLGPAAGALGAASLASGAQWATATSYDWFWHYPAITAPAAFLFGAAAAPALMDVRSGPSRRTRLASIAPLCVLAALSVPAYLGERYLQTATENASGDPAAAIADADRAEGLNPFDDRAALLEGSVASELGDRALAIDSFEEAIDREPENYAGYYFLARELLPDDPAGAAAALDRARELNPDGPEIAQLTRRLDEAP